MKEITTINDAKQIMKKLNIVIYGSIRNIENDFTTSFSNIDAICNYFNNVYIIILENDSSDNTRTLLLNWAKIQSHNLQKHVILKNNLDDIYSLRAHRLAYCRNIILNYIVDNNLHLSYQYAMHCDLDDRFWSIDYNSICNCFQYDLNNWDAMSCVNTNKDYYDYWALRCDQSWFNINIFSCSANKIDYTTKVDSFKALLKNTNGLIQVTSSFNGLAIYKMKSIIYCRYNADYKCSICNNENRGCFEDNDHIGLHNQMTNNNCKLFINTKMYIQSKPHNSISYYEFMKNITNTKIISQNILLYVLMNNLVNAKGKWIMSNVNVSDSDVANIITNYYDDNLYVFNCKDETPQLLFNKNITIINGPSKDNISFFTNSTLLKDEFISFIYINCYKYHDVKDVLYSVFNKIKEETIIIFNNLIYFKDNTLEGLKALYEFTQEYEINFEWLLINNNQQNNGSVAIKINSNIYFNHVSENIDYSSIEYESFNWIFYTTHHSDLMHITTKEDAYRHWMIHGKHEGRVYEPPVNQIKPNNETEIETFEWDTYLELNQDLKDSGINGREEAIRHWLHHGKQENREHTFDWCSYIKKYNLISQSIDTKIKAINHWLDSGQPEINNNEKNPDMEMFDWKFYIHNYNDLKHLDNEASAYTHWSEFGKAEGRICNNFRWTNYLLYNKDLLSLGINTEELAIEHWVKYGKKENRKI